MRLASLFVAVLSTACLVIGGSPAFHGVGTVAYADEDAVESAQGDAQESTIADADVHFRDKIAPLIAHHCLECHDAATKEGGLNLSRKEAATTGGDSGPAWEAGDAEGSLLWLYVESDEMPQDRPPLSGDEKMLLRQWIEAGAAWSVENIESVAHGRGTAYTGIRRLTIPEYIETIRATVGVNIEQDARRILPPDLRADGFSNTAYNLNVDLGHVEAYARLAQIVVSRLDVRTLANSYSDRQELSDDSLRKIIAGAGKKLLRGPLDEREIAAYLQIAKSVEENGGDFGEAVGYIFEAMLQSPRFIYHIEAQRGDGKPRPVDGYELASRLSFLIWGGPPDEELMKAADEDRLSDRGTLEAQVRRMLEDPRAIERSEQFVHEWLNLGRLENLRPNTDRFPKWNEQLAADMRAETLAFFKDVAWKQDRPLADLLNAQVTYATPALAEYYGLDAAAAEAESAAPLRGIPRRSAPGLEVMYTFEEGGGSVVRDVSGAGEPVNLSIADTKAVEWGPEGLTVGRDGASTIIASDSAARRLIEAVKKSNAATLEAWITTADTDQSGPARILTLSDGANSRNFTLGQDSSKYDVRFRSSRTNGNGLPSVSSPGNAVKKRATHVVYTRDATGRSKLYIDGEQQAAGNIDGDLSNWDGNFRLALANEFSNDRPWQGTFHQIAVFSRALPPDEIRSRGAGLSRFDLSSTPSRGGLLTQGSVLTVGGEEASMVTRGLFVLHDLLNSAVSDPPPCVDTTPVPTQAGLSQRAIAEARLANASCGGCHKKFETLAFGLEKFDGLGAVHVVDEHGNKLREDGEILFPGEESPVSYETSGELMDLLAESPRVQETLTRQVVQFAIGRQLVAADDSIVAQIHDTAQQGGGTYADLITAIVMSDLVRMTATEPVPQQNAIGDGP
ncbi:MAG: DUF1592 domain-containing protein [Pirellulales bacterium]